MQPVQRPLFALALRLAGVVIMSTMFMLVKYTCEAGIALPELMFWRQLIPVVLIAGWLGAKGEFGRLRTKRLGSHAQRAVDFISARACGPSS